MIGRIQNLKNGDIRKEKKRILGREVDIQVVRCEEVCHILTIESEDIKVVDILKI